MSIPPAPASEAAGAAAASAKLSTLNSSSTFGSALGTGLAPCRGEPLRSTALDSYLIAFSMTGSTYLRIPSLRSKS